MVADIVRTTTIRMRHLYSEDDVKNGANRLRAGGMIRRSAAMAAVSAGAFVGAILIAPTAAQAHEQTVFLDRAGCGYYGWSNHGQAETARYSGSCSGHAWLRVNWNGNLSSWTHGLPSVRFTAPGLSGIAYSQHKSCETCSVSTILH
ncbi:hypothetical protein [Actinoplanes italicus]|nr:hypothetical protein [Actinoplanes italicus]